ncbi:MAG: hypothetical protein NVS2B12_41610 [Ktedonobacteraceae bacterium]
MSTIILGLLLIIDLLVLRWWINKKLNDEESYHAYNLLVYNSDGGFKRVEGLPDTFSALESAQECFMCGAQKIILTDHGSVKRLFTRQDYETGLYL